jgi:glycosyltransferase involved in cell wall biosynthesis
VKIAVEANVLAREPQSGVYYYVQRLLKAMATIKPSDAYSLIYLGRPGRTLADLGLPATQFDLKRVHWLPRKLYNLFLRTPFGLPLDLISGVHPDLFLFPSFARWPLLRPYPSVVIIYDTAYLDFPEVIETWHFKWYLERAVPRALKRASRVVVISESTRQSLVKHYGVSPEKITVVVPAVEHTQFKPAAAAEIQKIRHKYQTGDNYILFLGTLEPRKNMARVIAAYLALPLKVRSQYKLVLAGARGWKDTELLEAADKLEASELVMTGFIEEADLATLYSGAAVFVYPSLYEGWGMPVLEAMACGTPVITANNSSLPEAGGTAAVYIDAQATEQLTQALSDVLLSPTRRSQMSQEGLKHAANFTWEASAARLHKVFEEATQQ